MNGFVRAPLDVLGNAGRNENWSRVNEEERSRRTETEDSRGGDGNFANHANQSTTRGVTSIRRRTAARREVRHMDAIMTLIQHIDSGCMHLATKVLIILGSAVTRPTEVLEILLPHAPHAMQAAAPRSHGEMNAAGRKIVRASAHAHSRK